MLPAYFKNTSNRICSQRFTPLGCDEARIGGSAANISNFKFFFGGKYFIIG